MTTDEIKRMLAKRDGWTDTKASFMRQPDYLNSKDAIGRVLGKLTEKEWKRLHDAIWNRWFDVRDGETLTAKSEVVFILAMPARVLARCVAEAIKK